MPITATPTEIPDVLIIEPKVFGDERGFFFESFNDNDFSKAVGQKITFVQDNHSQSKRGVLRGLHYQIHQTQAKLVRVVRGSVFDVAVDLRQSSATFGKWVGVELSANNKKQLWIPEGFAHGFLTLSEEVEFLYKTTDYYEPRSEVVLSWSDPFVSIKWPMLDVPYELSQKDRCAITWHECPKF